MAQGPRANTFGEQNGAKNKFWVPKVSFSPIFGLPLSYYQTLSKSLDTGLEGLDEIHLNLEGQLTGADVIIMPWAFMAALKDSSTAQAALDELCEIIQMNKSNIAIQRYHTAYVSFIEFTSNLMQSDSSVM